MNITVRQCMIGETEWFHNLEGEYHYMGESHGAGDCGQGILSRTPRLAGQGLFSETSGWKRKETVCLRSVA